MVRLHSREIAPPYAAGTGSDWGAWTLVAVSTLLAGCGTQLPGVVSPDGYVSGRYALGVRKGHDAPAAAGLMPEGWKLDNFNGDEPKGGTAYRTIIRIDANGDGDSSWRRRHRPSSSASSICITQAWCGCEPCPFPRTSRRRICAS